MKTTSPNWNMSRLQRMEKKGEFRFDYPIQRSSGQWDILQKSLLVHSDLADMPIPPIAVAKAEVNGVKGEYVIDGKQRCTTILDYMSGVKDKNGHYPDTAFKLHPETPAVMLGDKEVGIADLYFDQLHEDLQAELKSSSFMIQRMEDATDEEIEEIFNRWNNGTPLSKQQKARGKMGTANATVVASLLNHKFIQEVAQFTPLQRRRSDDEAVILQTMMLKNTDNLTSFVADKVLEFASDMRDADITESTNEIKDAFDYILMVDVKSALFKKLHLPTVIMVAKKAYADNVDPRVFAAWVEDFNMAITFRKRENALVQTKYKDHTGAGSVKRDKVLGRLNAMLNHFNSFVKQYEIPKEESNVVELKPQNSTKQKEEKLVDEEVEKAFAELKAEEEAKAKAEKEKKEDKKEEPKAEKKDNLQKA